MENKVLKRLALGTAAFVFATALTGCGTGNKTADETPDKYPGSEVKVNGDEIYPIQCDDTLTYWMNTSATWTHKFENFGETPIGQQIAKETGVKIEYIHPTEGQGKEQFQLLLASNELPDIINSDWSGYPGGPDTAIGEKYIYKLNNIIEKYAPALTKVLAEHPDWDKQSKTDSGSYYIFPFMMDGKLLQVAQGPTVRGDWMKELNLEAPTTIDEWETVLTAFKEKKGVKAPFTSSLDSLLATFSSGFGVQPKWYKDGDTVVYGPATQGYKNLLIKMNDWYNKGLIDPDIAVIDSKMIDTKMLNGDAGATIAWAGSGIGQWLKANSNVSGYDLQGVQFPATNKGENAEYSALTAPVLTYCGSAINTNCKNPELAARFLDYGFTEKGHNLFNFGIEGESYNWVDGYPKYTDLIMKNPDGLSVANAMGLYIRACYNGIMVQDQRYIEQYYPTHQQKDAQKEWAKTNMDAHLLPQLYVATNDMERDSDVMTSVQTYVTEMTLKFITGQEPIENYDNYLAQLETFGVKDATKFRQEALKRYNER